MKRVCVSGTFLARKSYDEPPGYRVWFDDGTGELEVGSIVQRERYTSPRLTYWHWGVDTFPLAGGQPSGVTSFNEAVSSFRTEFLHWVNELPPGSWQRNRDYKKANATRHLR